MTLSSEGMCVWRIPSGLSNADVLCWLSSCELIQEAMRTTLSLATSMLENDVVAICRYAPDAAKHLQLMALIPQRDEELDFVVSQSDHRLDHQRLI